LALRGAGLTHHRLHPLELRQHPLRILPELARLALLELAFAGLGTLPRHAAHRLGEPLRVLLGTLRGPSGLHQLLALRVGEVLELLGQLLEPLEIGIAQLAGGLRIDARGPHRLGETLPAGGVPLEVRRELLELLGETLPLLGGHRLFTIVARLALLETLPQRLDRLCRGGVVPHPHRQSQIPRGTLLGHVEPGELLPQRLGGAGVVALEHRLEPLLEGGDLSNRLETDLLRIVEILERGLVDVERLVAGEGLREHLVLPHLGDEALEALLRLLAGGVGRGALGEGRLAAQVGQQQGEPHRRRPDRDRPPPAGRRPQRETFPTPTAMLRRAGRPRGVLAGGAGEEIPSIRGLDRHRQAVPQAEHAIDLDRRGEFTGIPSDRDHDRRDDGRRGEHRGGDPPRGKHARPQAVDEDHRKHRDRGDEQRHRQRFEQSHRAKTASAQGDESTHGGGGTGVGGRGNRLGRVHHAEPRVADACHRRRRLVAGARLVVGARRHPPFDRTPRRAPAAERRRLVQLVRRSPAADAPGSSSRSPVVR